MGDGVTLEHGQNAQLNVVEDLRPVQGPAVTRLQLLVELNVMVMLRNPRNAILTLAQVRTASVLMCYFVVIVNWVGFPCCLLILF